LGPVGRFTKDRVSPAVWWPLAIVLLGLFALTFPGEQRSLRGSHIGSAWFVDLPQAWLWYRWAAGIAAGIVLLLALLSFRRSVARIGAGVRLYPSSIPEGQVLVDEARLETLEEHEDAGAHAKDRITNLERRLRESEANRLETEGELKRMLADRAGSKRAKAAAPTEVPTEVAPEPLPPEPAGKAPDELIRVPEIDPSPASEPERSPSGWPEVVVLPNVTATRASAPPPGESAVDMLNRMVEPVETPTASNDPSLLRSRLARTAALKKPGSRERRDEPDEPITP
jgi:hypothetical protein